MVKRDYEQQKFKKFDCKPLNFGFVYGHTKKRDFQKYAIVGPEI